MNKKELIKNKSVLFCEDSIVRGTQLIDTINVLYENGAKEVHMRPACPPLIYGCNFLNFSRSKSENELAGQRAIRAIEGIDEMQAIPREILAQYEDENSEKYAKMVEWIRVSLKLTTLRYQKISDMIAAIGLPKEKLCLGCWKK